MTSIHFSLLGQVEIEADLVEEKGRRMTILNRLRERRREEVERDEVNCWIVHTPLIVSLN